MKRILYGIAACFLAVGCSGEPTEESVGEGEQALLDVENTKGLTLNQGTLPVGDTPAHIQARADDTRAYYASVVVDPPAIGGGPFFSIESPVSGGASIGVLTTLTDFTNRYFVGTETVAYYYNRGDLGIGREMHCDNELTATGGQVACYVKNFAAGADNTEFVFGESASIAFSNMAPAKDNYFATVAMVFRNGAAAANNVFFVVYKPDGTLAHSAALDRTGGLAAAGLLAGHPGVIDGVQYNSHIPSNCVSCHAGGVNYNATSKSVTGALFLPFDLDQFEYQTDAGKTRDAQLTKFKELNQMVWRVAALSGSDVSVNGNATHPVEDLLDGWYGNRGLHEAQPKDEVFPGNFDGTIPPLGWTLSPGNGLYTSVVRSSCRNCHVTNMRYPFDSQNLFDAYPASGTTGIASLISDFTMPHSLQTIRQFWQSGQPASLTNYWIAKGDSSSLAAAATLRGAGPRNVATLDPPAITATISLVVLQ